MTLSQILEIVAITLGILINILVIIRYFNKIETRFTRIETILSTMLRTPIEDYADITRPDFARFRTYKSKR